MIVSQDRFDEWMEGHPGAALALMTLCMLLVSTADSWWSR